MEFLKNRPLVSSIALFVIVLFGLACFSIPFIIKAILFFALLIFSVVFSLLKKKLSTLSLLSFGVCLSLLVSYLYFDCYVNKQKSYFNDQYTIECKIENITYQSNYATYCDVEISKINDEPCNINAKLDCSYFLDVSELDIISLKVLISDFDETHDDFDEKSYYNSKGYYSLCTSINEDYQLIGKSKEDINSLFKKLNDFCQNRFKTILDDESIGMCSALLLGNKSLISASLKRDFSQIGISHMLAVSGLHMTVLIGGIFFVLRKIFANEKVPGIICIAFCFLYMGLVGFIPSVVRAGIMYIIMCFSKLLKKDFDSLTSLFFAGFIIILLNPSSIFDPSFLLSFFATLGIVLLYPVTIFALSKIKIGFLRQILTPISITFSAVLFTIPITSIYFGKLYPLVPVSNLLISPFISCFLFLSFLAVPLSYVPIINNVISFALKIIFQVVRFTTSFFVRLNVPSITTSYPFVKYIVFGLLISIIVILAIKIKPWIIFFPIVLSIITFFVLQLVYLSNYNGYTYLSFYNDAKNDLMLVNESNTSYIFDMSSGGKRGVNSLIYDSKSVFYDYDLDYYILTHYHEYSYNTIDKITDTNYVKTVCLPEPNTESDKQIYNSLISMIGKKGINIIDYSNYIHFSKNFEYELLLGTGKNKHPIINANFRINDRNIYYLGQSWGKILDDIEDFDVAFLGAHGPKQYDEYNLKCDLSIIANHSVLDMNNIISKKVIDLSKLDDIFTVKFRKK